MEMTHRPYRYLVILSALVVCLCWETSATRRQKRETFDFPTDGDVNWDDNLATVPTLDGPPPDLPDWSDAENLNTLPTASVPISDGSPNDSLPVPKEPIDDHGVPPIDDHPGVPTTPIDTESAKATTTPPTNTLTPIKNYRHDCPPSKNFCIYLNPCTRDQWCAMNLQCKNYVCVDKKKPSVEGAEPKVGSVPEETKPTTDPSIPSTTGGSQCPIQCVHGKCVEKPLPNGVPSVFCNCDKDWTEIFCDTLCTLDCVEGTCHSDVPDGTPPWNVSVDNMSCNCKAGWQGSLCQEVTPDYVDEARRRTLTIGLSLGLVLFVVMALSALTLVVLWRKRVIVVMKLVYFFKVEEIDDGRYYDAYISMGSSNKGIDFVKDKLCPILQDFGFSVYFHARDRLAGEVIVESIHRAMEQSRRTILIVTPEYLRNEWSTFECVIAQIETLKLHQRIIPIVLEDISAEKENMNKTLKHILASVKCLKFPTVKSDEKVCLKEKKRKEDKFWQRLKLTMPKKKMCKDKNEADTEITDLDDVVVRDPRPIDVGSIDLMYSHV